MSIKTLSGGTSYDLSIHLVLVTKYRQSVITPKMMNRLEEIFRETCEKWCCTLVEFNGETDHVHLLIEITPKVLISSFANNIKTVSSRLIRKEFPEECSAYYQKPVFWKIGYFVSSTGGANLKTVREYIEKQNKKNDK